MTKFTRRDKTQTLEPHDLSDNAYTVKVSSSWNDSENISTLGFSVFIFLQASLMLGKDLLQNMKNHGYAISMWD